MSWTEPSIAAPLLCTRSLEFLTTRGRRWDFRFFFFCFGHCLARFFGFCTENIRFFGFCVCYGFRFFLILALLSMQIKFFPIVCQPQFFLLPWVSRHDFFLSDAGYCTSNTLWLDLLKPIGSKRDHE